MKSMKPTFFATPPAFRAWLAANHATAAELLVGFHKGGSGRPSITWPESVDQALCFGWIDGVRRSLGDESYTIRFTPRRPRSIWSAINIEALRRADAQGQVAPPASPRSRSAPPPARASTASSGASRPACRPARRRRSARTARVGLLPVSPALVPADARLHWVVSAKKEETRDKRLRTLIADSAAGRTIGPLTRPGAKAG